MDLKDNNLESDFLDVLHRNNRKLKIYDFRKSRTASECYDKNECLTIYELNFHLCANHDGRVDQVKSQIVSMVFSL